MIRLLVGLGNPGPSYEATRHNVGFWWVDELARRHGAHLVPESKVYGKLVRLPLRGEPRWLLQPTTFMNRSGQSVGALARYYKVASDEILVVHDELDLPPGKARLKQGGGHGGHNGLRDLIAHLGSRDFHRLRLGIGHPGNAKDVTDYVLGRPSAADRQAIETAMDEALTVIDQVLDGEMQKAMNHLHSTV